MMTSGRLVTIEGIDGAGTTTQAKMLVDWISARGRKGVYTCEPSGGPVGLLLRQILSGRTVVRRNDGEVHPVNNEVISLLFAADRMDHLDNEVIPLLESGVEVVTDRYYHSSFTYQALQGDLDWIRNLNARARIPDMTFILDLPAEQAAARRQQAGRAVEEIYETQSTQLQLRDAYRKLPELLSDEDILIVDGSPEAQSVHRVITEDLVARFGWS
jgi:dTMP kinase